MATKISNSSLYNLIFNCNRYHTPDIYLNLVHISLEIQDKVSKEYSFVVQTGDDKKSSLVRVLMNFSYVDRQTVVNCLNEIIDLGLISYDYNSCGWVLAGMNNMFVPKSSDFKAEGFTKLRKYLLSKEFSKIKLREKKLFLYMNHLADSKGFEKFSAIQKSDFVVNLLNKNSIWVKLLRTTSKYYAKYALEHFLKIMSDNIYDKSEEFRNTKLKPRTILNFTFYFDCSSLREAISCDEVLEVTLVKEISLIKEYMALFDVGLTLHKIYQLAHSIASLSKWTVKEQVVKIMMNKFRAIQIYNSREKIKSIPAYVNSVIKSVLEEFREPTDVDILSFSY